MDDCRGLDRAVDVYVPADGVDGVYQRNKSEVCCHVAMGPISVYWCRYSVRETHKGTDTSDGS